MTERSSRVYRCSYEEARSGSHVESRRVRLQVRDQIHTEQAGAEGTRRRAQRADGKKEFCLHQLIPHTVGHMMVTSAL